MAATFREWEKEVQPTFANSFWDYVYFLGLPRDGRLLEQLLGDTVLDIGSGIGWFAKGVADNHIPTRVVELNPQLMSGGLSLLQGVEHQCVAGVVGSLPFADESFDCVVSLAAFPTVYNEAQVASVEDYAQGYKEIWRVLRPGKRAFLSYIGQYALEKNLAAIAHVPNLTVQVHQLESDVMTNANRFVLTRSENE